MKKKKVKKWPLFVILMLICMIFGVLYFFKGYFQKDIDDNKPDILEKEEAAAKEYSVTLTLGGNVLINSNMWYDTLDAEGKYNFNNVFEYLNDMMKKSNINYYSQQSIVGGKELGVSAYYNYNSPTDIIDSLKEVGFNMLSLASYHSYDKGIAGITNSINYLKEKQIAFSGVSDTNENKFDNNIITKNGLKIGILSYATKTDEIINEDYAVSIYSDEKVKVDYEHMKTKADVVMVTIDWTEYKTEEVSEEQKRIAKYLSELGVNIVVGNTGYGIQPIEIIGNTLVCYSLGNLLSGHTSVDSRISAMVDFKYIIEEKNEERTIKIDDINVLLTYCYNNNNIGYKVIPFTKISTELTDYKTYYNKYNELLSSDEFKIKLYSIGD